MIRITVTYTLDVTPEGIVVMPMYQFGLEGIENLSENFRLLLEQDVYFFMESIPTIILEDGIVLPTIGANSSTFEWTSLNPVYINNEGTILSMPQTSTMISIEGVVTNGTESINIHIQKYIVPEYSIEEALNEEDQVPVLVTGVVYEVLQDGVFIESDGKYLFVYDRYDNGYLDGITVDKEITIVGDLYSENGLKSVVPLDASYITVSSKFVFSDVSTIDCTIQCIANNELPKGSRVKVTAEVDVVTHYLGDTIAYQEVWLRGLDEGSVRVIGANEQLVLTQFNRQVIEVEVVFYKDRLVVFTGDVSDVVVVESPILIQVSTTDNDIDCSEIDIRDRTVKQE